MNKFYLTLSALIVAGGSVFAQAKLDMACRTFMRGNAQLEATNKFKSIQNPNAETHSVIIRLAEGQTVEELQEAGVDITDVISDRFVTATVTRPQLAKVERMKSVASVSSSRRVHLHNDQARKLTNIDAVHSGTGLDQAYKGKGVLVAIVDGGFNPNHVAFMEDDCATSRVKKLVNYTINQNTGAITGVKEYSGSTLASFSTDDSSETHGTHTSGIATGGTAGGKTPYYGMAPEANILMYAGLTNEAILRSAKDAKEYAKQQGMPLVISMSLGDNIGPHDGTDDFTAALNEIAKDVPICLSAGNEADLNIVINKTFTSSDMIAKTALVPNGSLASQSSYAQAVGDVVVYSDDASDFDAEFAIVNKTTGAKIYSYQLTSEVTYLASGEQKDDGDLEDVNFANYYPDSYIGMFKGLDSNNNRMCAMFNFELYNSTTSAKVLPVIIVKGKDGQTVRIYSDGYYTDFTTATGYDQPTANGTISNMACGKNTISVGAYNSNNVTPYYGNVIGDITYFSSYGKLADGRVLPTVCAPGCVLVSAMSYYYTKNSYAYDSYYTPKTGVVKVGTKTHYYTPMQGTSMSCPVMSGTTALWLQANPNLTPVQIAQIAKETAVAPANYTLQWGASGKLDAYAGLKKALEMAGVEEIEADGNQSVLVNQIADCQFEVFAVDAKALNVMLYNMAGQLVASASAEGNTAVLDAAAAGTGVYVLKVAGNNVNYTQKVVVK